METQWQRSTLAVPRDDHQLLAIPALTEAAAQTRANAAALATHDIDMQGRSLSRLRREGRGELLREARHFTRYVLEDDHSDADCDAPLVCVGHQPAMYHPGVWAKNFAAGQIAEGVGGHVLNLVVDNDLHARSAIDVPIGTRDDPSHKALPFDHLERGRPWEGAGVRDPELFQSFGQRVTAAMAHWDLEPLIHASWSSARRALAAGRSLPECLTAFRHGVELDWGHRQLELPMSRLCQSEPFLWVAGHLLAQLPRFVEIHNDVLAEFRTLYRIKSRNHPVPKLESRDDWLEAPFWVWRDEEPTRRRAFARTEGKRTLLADETGRLFAELPLNETMEACCAVEVLRDLPRQGIHFRTRALTTTLFTRVVLADTFVHGIGGARYDEMTDRIIARLWGITPPAYATVSASLYLPFAAPFDVTAEDERRLRGQLRQLQENPEQSLAGDEPEVARLMAVKESLIAEQHAADARQGLSRRQRRRLAPENHARYQRLREVTEQLAERTRSQAAAIQEELASVQSRRRANGVLTNREFSFVLYPESKLRPFLEEIEAGEKKTEGKEREF